MAPEISTNTPQVAQALVPRRGSAAADTQRSGSRVRQAESRRQEAEQEVRRSQRQKQQAVERLRQARDNEQQAARRLREAQAEHMSTVGSSQSRPPGSVVNVLV